MLYEITGHRLVPAFTIGEAAPDEDGEGGQADAPTSEEDLVSLLKDTFDASEVEEPAP